MERTACNKPRTNCTTKVGCSKKKSKQV